MAHGYITRRERQGKKQESNTRTWKLKKRTEKTPQDQL